MLKKSIVLIDNICIWKNIDSMLNMKFLILFVIMFVFVFRIMASEELVENSPFSPFINTIEVCDKHVALFLDEQSLIALSKTNKYWRTLLLDQKVWRYAAASLLGMPLSSCFARDYVLNTYSYTFQDVDDADGYTKVRLSDDGSTVILTRWDVQSKVRPCTKIIKRNGTRVILEECWANAVSPDGSVIAGWHAIPGTTKCAAFRWTKARGLELLPQAAGRSIALKIVLDIDRNIIISGTIEDPLVQGSTFHWQDDQVTVSGQGVISNIDTLSADESIAVRAEYKHWYSWNTYPERCNYLDHTKEFLDDILELPKGYQLEKADSLCSKGIFMAGFGTKDGKRRVWLATVPKSHIAAAPQPSFCEKVQNTVTDLALQAFSNILFKYTKYCPLPI